MIGISKAVLPPKVVRVPSPAAEMGFWAHKKTGNVEWEYEIQKGQYPIKEREHWHHLLDSSVWNKFKYRDDDIVISAYSKSGTTWVQPIVAQLIWMGTEHISVSEVSPWLDCRFPFQEERLEIVEAQTHRRFIKSHLPVDALVFSPKAKYIYIGRDGRDILWS